MEEKKKGKGLKVFLVIFIILFVLSACALGYGYTKYKDLDNNYKKINTKYENINNDLEKTKSDLEKIQEEQKKAKKAEDESYSTDYDYRLKNVSCELDGNTCTKKLKIKYGDKNHNIKIVQKLKKSKKPIYGQEDDNGNEIQVYAYNITYQLYEDDVLIDSVKEGFYSVPEDSSLSSDSLNFDGYLYIFNKKYLGFLYNYGGDAGSWGYDLNLYNEGKLVKNILIDQPANSFGKNGGGLDNIENIEFDGTTLKYWFMECSKKYNKALRIYLTFDGKSVATKVGEVKKGIIGGGAEPVCYNTKTNSYNR